MRDQRHKICDRWLTISFIIMGVSVLGWLPRAFAIEVNPNAGQVQEALHRGMAAAEAKTPPNQLYWQFGSSERVKPQGFLMTKLGGLTVMSAHFALRAEQLSDQDIQRILDDTELQVSVTILGSSPEFAVDSYMVLKQQNRLIKPTRVRSDGRAAPSSAWPEFPAYHARVVASFAYGTFDPSGSTSVTVFPGEGGEVSFQLDFSTIP